MSDFKTKNDMTKQILYWLNIVETTETKDMTKTTMCETTAGETIEPNVEDIIIEYLNAGVDINITSEDKNSQYNHSQYNYNQYSQYQTNLLHLAALFQFKKLTKYLLGSDKYTNDTNARDYLARTAKEISSVYSDKEIYNMIDASYSDYPDYVDKNINRYVRTGNVPEIMNIYMSIKDPSKQQLALSAGLNHIKKFSKLKL